MYLQSYVNSGIVAEDLYLGNLEANQSRQNACILPVS